MPSVHLDSCCFAHSSAVPVLSDVTLDLADTWVGVVGANGAGKSTLLGLVAGTLKPTAGRCTVVADRWPALCFVLLDEPTNHLDLPSIEHLEEAVAGFAGAVVLATHDRGVARATTSTTWRVHDGRVAVEH